MAGFRHDEETQWTLRKDDRIAEGRISSDGTEFRIYTSTAGDEALSVMWSQPIKDTRAGRSLSLAKKEEFLAAGWVDAPRPMLPAPTARRRGAR